MSDGTKIEWTDATWNVITGCAIKSPGCADCYAMKLSGTRLRNHPSRFGLTSDTKAGPVWNGKVRFNEEWLTQPLAWRRPRRIFVCAHGDLFHEAVPDDWIDRVFAAMALAPQHTFQVLTKRQARMRAYLTQLDQEPHRDTVKRLAAAISALGRYYPLPDKITIPLPHVWVGVSVEDQRRADERIPDLLATPAAVRFISAEPLLGPIDLRAVNRAGVVQGLDALRDSDQGKLDWIIVGGESGPGARPMLPNWARSLRDQCAAASVPFFLKQWGEYAPARTSAPPLSSDVQKIGDHPVHVGKKAAGRLLDGVEHNGMPERKL